MNSSYKGKWNGNFWALKWMSVVLWVFSITDLLLKLLSSLLEGLNEQSSHKITRRNVSKLCMNSCSAHSVHGEKMPLGNRGRGQFIFLWDISLDVTLTGLQLIDFWWTVMEECEKTCNKDLNEYLLIIFLAEILITKINLSFLSQQKKIIFN